MRTAKGDRHLALPYSILKSFEGSEPVPFSLTHRRRRRRGVFPARACGCSCCRWRGWRRCARQTPANGKRSNSRSPRCTRRNRQAPMFSGSSCTQNTGVPSAYCGERLAQQVARERIKLLDADDRHVVALELVALLLQLEIDLAGAEEDAFDSILQHWSMSGITSRKLPVAHSSSVLSDLRMTQQRLGRHDHQRLAPDAQHLPAQAVEVLRGRGEVADLDVVFGGQREESFQAGAASARAPALRSRAARAARCRRGGSTCLRR